MPLFGPRHPMIPFGKVQSRSPPNWIGSSGHVRNNSSAPLPVPGRSTFSLGRDQPRMSSGRVGIGIADIKRHFVQFCLHSMDIKQICMKIRLNIDAFA
jgi:hypothetical protein